MVEDIYPHTIIVSRDSVSDDPYQNDTTAEIFNGKCCCQISGNGGTGETNGVSDSDYTVFIESIDIEFKKGDNVSIVMKDGYSPIKGTVKQNYFSELGITLWIKEYEN